MGQVVKQVSNHSTRYYWYPGDKKEWVRGVVALAVGGAAYALLHLLTQCTLLAAVIGTSLAAGCAGFNFGRRDSRELARFADLAKSKYVRRQTAVHTGRAVWRGVAEGTGGAAAAVIIVNLTERGFLADWLLPLVPAVVGALAHQTGMMYERLGTSESIEGPAKRAATTPAPAAALKTEPGRVVGSARVPVMPLSAKAAGKLLPVASAAGDPATVLRFDPVADCGTVAAAKEAAQSSEAAQLSSHHAAVALPGSVSTYKHGKPPMPLSAAIAARGDLAHIADALGAESLTESRRYSAK